MQTRKIIGTVAITGILGAGLTLGARFFPTQDSHTPQEERGQTLPSAAPGSTFETTVTVEGVGKILVQVELPKTPRYSEGAPVIVNIPNSFTPDTEGFHGPTNFTPEGLILISFMYPGRSDGQGHRSEGTDDFGGPDSIKALRDVLLFAMGEKENSSGQSLNELSEIHPLEKNVGIYAFSHPGIAATVALGTYTQELKNIAFFVGRENPTIDSISALEIGYWRGPDEKKIPTYNPLYNYPVDYSPTHLNIDYSTISYDLKENAPFFDDNGSGRWEPPELLLSTHVPKMFGKRFYSRDLLHALEDKGTLPATSWPKDLATPKEADEIWAERETPAYYANLSALPHLHTLLIFSKNDHVQVAADKPHVHQAYDGFTAAGIWTRLNPDSSYVGKISSDLTRSYTEHPANQEPGSWADIASWAYDSSNTANAVFPLAAVLEMADRTHENNWEDDLN